MTKSDDQVSRKDDVKCLPRFTPQTESLGAVMREDKISCSILLLSNLIETFIPY